MTTAANLYLSHSWSSGDSYEKLLRILRSDTAQSLRFFGLAKDDPLHATGADYELRAEMRSQMMKTPLVIVQGAQYGRFSRWIDQEVDLAASGFDNRRRVLVVVPFSSESIDPGLAARADRVVAWKSAEILAAVREMCSAPLEPVVAHAMGPRTSGARPAAPAVATFAVPLRRSPAAPAVASPRSSDLRRTVFGKRAFPQHQQFNQV